LTRGEGIVIAQLAGNSRSFYVWNPGFVKYYKPVRSHCRCKASVRKQPSQVPHAIMPSNKERLYITLYARSGAPKMPGLEDT
jgi:hypothetical protein